MMERADTPYPAERYSPAWHRPASGKFDAPAGRPGRPRANLPARQLPVERPAGQPLRRRGRKAPEVPLILKPADPDAGLWTRAAPKTNRMTNGKGRRRRIALTTREMIIGPPPKWIGPTPREELERNSIVALEALIFGNPAVAEGSWQRPAAAPERTEWPLPPSRVRGEIRARPLPRRKVVVPLRGRR